MLAGFNIRVLLFFMLAGQGKLQEAEHFINLGFSVLVSKWFQV